MSRDLCFAVLIAACVSCTGAHSRGGSGGSGSSGSNETRADLVGSLLDAGHDLLNELHGEFLANSIAESKQDVSSKFTARTRWLSFGRVFMDTVNDLVTTALPKVAEITFGAQLSENCTMSLLEGATAARQGSAWVFRMIDATGFLTPGLLDGSITTLGAYDECLAITSNTSTIRGQYCLIRWSLPLPPQAKRVSLQDRVLDFKGTDIEGTVIDDMASYSSVFYERHGRNGICIPSGCSKKDVEQLVKYLLKDTGMNTSVGRCETATDKIVLQSHHAAILTIICVLVTLMVLGTCLEARGYCDPSNRPSKLVRSISSFSIISNFDELLSTKNSGIGCIHGLRCLSMAWILYTHTYLASIMETFAFARFFMYAVEGTGFQLVLNGWVLVDTFFVLSAALSCMAIFRALNKTRGKINFVQTILSRLARLTPSLWFTVALGFVVPVFGSGPLWWEYWAPQVRRCEANFWATMVYASNWINVDDMCYLPSWYLAADFQLFVVGIFIAALLWRWPKVTFWALVLLAISSATAVGALIGLSGDPPTVMYNTPTRSEPDEATDRVYTPTYVHLAPYCVGLLLGFALHHLTKRQVTFPRKVNFGLWLMSLAAMLVILMVTRGWNRGVPWTSRSAALYGGSHRIGWSLAVAWIVLSCATGNGGPINTFLSWKLFIPLSRLSFAVYLHHFMVLWVRYASIRWTLPFGHYTMLCEFIVNYCMSTVVAAVAYLMVEAPCSQLYKMWLADCTKWAEVRIKVEKKPLPLDDGCLMGRDEQSHVCISAASDTRL